MKKILFTLSALISTLLLSGCYVDSPESIIPLAKGCLVQHKSSMVNGGKPLTVLDINYRKVNSYPSGVDPDKLSSKRRSHLRHTTLTDIKIRVGDRQWFYMSAFKSYSCNGAAFKPFNS